jgi:hypothetical protein
MIVPVLAAGLQMASAGDITGTVTLNGTPPPEQPNTMMADNADCGKLHSEPVTTHFFLVGPNKGLADVVITLKGISAKSTGESAPPLVLDQKGCEYIPYIAVAQTNQKIVAKNSDQLMHNVHPTPTGEGNKEQNKAQMAGGADVTFTFPTAEKFLRFKCDVHPWMFAYVTVVDNPYFAVSGKDGSFKIANVPAGKYTLEAHHRKASGGKPVSKEIEVKDGATSVDFTLEAPAPK